MRTLHADVEFFQMREDRNGFDLHAGEIDADEIRQVGVKSQSILFDFDGYFEKLEPEPDWL